VAAAIAACLIAAAGAGAHPVISGHHPGREHPAR